jgi:hypothetical protein
MNEDELRDDNVANWQFPDWPFWMAVAVSVATCLFAFAQWHKIATDASFAPLLIQQMK